MLRRTQSSILSIFTPTLLALFASAALAQAPTPAAEAGALAWSNWTKTASGGSGTLPPGVLSKDYVRCKACHGWDHLGTDGGYCRRSRKSTRPNAGAGDGDTTSRAITTGSVTADMVTHAGTGRTFDQGQTSWVDLDAAHSAANKAAHANGYTLGNQHPDFTGTGGLTQTQIDNLVAFLNYAGGDASNYFSKIDCNKNPALYTIVDTADAAAGETFYNNTCFFCHDDPATDHNGLNGGVPAGGLLAYLTHDGKFSELSHKARWGVEGSLMTRAQLGSPTAQNIADVMLYLQNLGGTGFAMYPGMSGHWWGGTTRDGEGFLIEISDKLDGTGAVVGTIVTVSFYTYDNMGNQVWLIGSAEATGNTAQVNMTMPNGGMWGAGFVPGDVVRTAWGTLDVSFSTCGNGHVVLTPNMAMMGFDTLEYDIDTSLTNPANVCP